MFGLTLEQPLFFGIISNTSWTSFWQSSTFKGVVDGHCMVSWVWDCTQPWTGYTLSISKLPSSVVSLLND